MFLIFFLNLADFYVLTRKLSHSGYRVLNKILYFLFHKQHDKSFVSPFWSVNFFRHTMNSKSPVVNLAKRHETLLVNKWVNCYWYLRSCARSFLNYSLWLFSKNKWSYHFIITQVIFRHFFSVGIGNELLRVFYNFNYPIQCTKLITFL